MTQPEAIRATLAQERDRLRDGLTARGFVDDGEVLRGPVAWVDEKGQKHQATVDVVLPPAYPFAPPQVELVDAGRPLDATFHRAADGLCLWDTSEPVTDAAWVDPERLVERVAGWLHNTSAGWPGDDDCDLERYIPGADAPGMVLYDREALRDIEGCVKTEADHNVRTVLAQPMPAPRPEQPRKGKKAKRRAAVPAAQRNLAYLADVGAVLAPLVSWPDIEAVLDARGREVRRLIQQSYVDLLLLWYLRGGREGVLALAVSPGGPGQPPGIKKQEIADTSTPTRLLRSGDQAEALAGRKVAVVGCGAVGSYVADLLFRDGVRQLTLVDYQSLRPGNVVRHAASTYLVGLAKVQAVKLQLLRTGLDTSQVNPRHTAVRSPDLAIELLQDHDLVIDATADERATSVMCWVASQLARPMITICVQRDGGVVRADRYPLRDGEGHFAPLPQREDLSEPLRERGCGDAVSRTAPSAVVAAAELAVTTARGLFRGDATAATTIRVLTPQHDLPYTSPTLIRSELPESPR